jgi:hypothetical protein
MNELSEEQIAELIVVLPPAPEGWVQAATELPSAREAIDRLVADAVADTEARQAMLADLERALREAGVEPRPPLVEGLRARLDALGS